MSTTPVSFGDYDPISGASTTAVGSILVTCDPGEHFRVVLDRGFHAPDFTPRLMKSSTGRLIQYNLYTSADHQTIFGDDTEGTRSVAGTGSGAQQMIFVHGQIPGSQNVAVGTYEDTVIVTVRF